MIDGKKAIRRLSVCLIALLIVLVAVSPALRLESSSAWAKNTKETTKSSKKKTKKKTTEKKKKTEKIKNGFVKKYGNWYYYEDGKKKTGWFTVGKRRFYAYKTGNKYRKGKLIMGWHTFAKKHTYYFRTEGKKGVRCSLAIDGVAKVNGIKCIFDKNGKLVACKNAGSTDGFINKVGEMARMNQAKNNILASLVVAQACLETGYGKNIYHNNLFGIRAGSGYRQYNSWQESMDDYVEFMHTYIPSIFGVRDSSTACYIIGASGYAEAGGYGGYLMSIINSNNLYRFNK